MSCGRSFRQRTGLKAICLGRFREQASLSLIVAFTLLGFLTANLVGRTLVGLGESLLNRMPIVRPVYNTMKQIFEIAVFQDRFKFPQGGAGGISRAWHVVAGVSVAAAERDLAKKLPQGEHVSAFMPCTPNPTTGFFFYVKRKDLIELDISVENAMTLLISAGMVQPDAEAQKKLASLAATAKAARAKRKAEAVK